MSKPDKQHLPHAASFRRIAKALRVRSRNHNGAAQYAAKAGELGTKCHEATLSSAFKAMAQELDTEAKLLRAMR